MDPPRRRSFDTEFFERATSSTVSRPTRRQISMKGGVDDLVIRYDRRRLFTRSGSIAHGVRNLSLLCVRGFDLFLGPAEPRTALNVWGWKVLLAEHIAFAAATMPVNFALNHRPPLT
jgi:hypothetical protein